MIKIPRENALERKPEGCWRVPIDPFEIQGGAAIPGGVLRHHWVTPRNSKYSRPWPSGQLPGADIHHSCFASSFSLRAFFGAFLRTFSGCLSFKKKKRFFRKYRKYDNFWFVLLQAFRCTQKGIPWENLREHPFWGTKLALKTAWKGNQYEAITESPVHSLLEPSTRSCLSLS